MKTESLGTKYDQIAERWEDRHKDSGYGVDYVVRAIHRVKIRKSALDVGCGSGGEIIKTILAAGFALTAIDVSANMLDLARRKHPSVTFVNDDFLIWESDVTFNLIVAWDSIFHAPRNQQSILVNKLCRYLAPGGILIFTAGGFDSEVSGVMDGITFNYGSLSYLEYLDIINTSNCDILTMERDQPRHMVFICKKEEID